MQLVCHLLAAVAARLVHQAAAPRVHRGLARMFPLLLFALLRSIATAMRLGLCVLEAIALVAEPAQGDHINQGVDLLAASAEGADSIPACKLQEHLLQVITTLFRGSGSKLVLSSPLGLFELSFGCFVDLFSLGSLLLLPTLPLRMELSQHGVRMICGCCGACAASLCLLPNWHWPRRNSCVNTWNVHLHMATPLPAIACDCQHQAVSACNALQYLQLLVARCLPLGSWLRRAEGAQQCVCTAFECLQSSLLLIIAFGGGVSC
mmetsp:Transcript_6416/g.15216  ORF Transcript_6416/g.15216 Transcript_6416/m.15216 type:complete len:263 (-) Transcript_6416:1205-1993(-)